MQRGFAELNDRHDGSPHDGRDVLDRLARSAFRRRFALDAAGRRYLRERGVEAVRAQAGRIVRQRLAAARPDKDGRQTPMRGHAVFVAQHATATCCRSCLAKWHGIDKGRALSEAEVGYVIGMIERWLRRQIEAGAGDQAPEQLRLFEGDSWPRPSAGS